jgi:hypothetical protein
VQYELCLGISLTTDGFTSAALQPEQPSPDDQSGFFEHHTICKYFSCWIALIQQVVGAKNIDVNTVMGVVRDLHPLFEDVADTLPSVQCWTISTALENRSCWDQNGIRRGKLWEAEISSKSGVITRFMNALIHLYNNSRRTEAPRCHVSEKDIREDNLARMKTAYFELVPYVNNLQTSRLAMESHINTQVT